MNRRLFPAGAILLISLFFAGFMVWLRLEPELRPLPSQIPFAVTTPVIAGTGAIPVYGAGTVRPVAEIDVAAEINGKIIWGAPTFQSGGRVRPVVVGGIQIATEGMSVRIADGGDP